MPQLTTLQNLKSMLTAPSPQGFHWNQTGTNIIRQSEINSNQTVNIMIE